MRCKPDLTESLFLRCFASSLHGEHIGAESFRGVDTESLLRLADVQRVLPFVYEAIRHLADEPGFEMLYETGRRVKRQVAAQAVKAEEFSAVYKALRGRGLSPIAVKGHICSRLYPYSDYRLSGDDDLVVCDEEFSECCEALRILGMMCDCSTLSRDTVTFTMHGSPLKIELHRRLFDTEEPNGQLFNGFFQKESVAETDGFLTLDAQLHLLYMMLHAWSHFLAGGVGIRQVCDIGLWACEYSDEIDFELLLSQCRKAGAGGFCRAVLAIACEVLQIPAENAVSVDNDSVEYAPLLCDIISGGVFGTSDMTRIHSSTLTLNAANDKSISVMRSLFPDLEYMKRSYSFLNWYPILLPAAWTMRIWHYLREKKGTGNSAVASLRLARERTELIRMYCSETTED